MNYTKAKLIVTPENGPSGEVLYYGIGTKSGGFMTVHPNKYMFGCDNVTIEDAKEIANFMSKSPEMYEALKLYISDLKNIVPQSKARDNRVAQMESLINEIEK